MYLKISGGFPYQPQFSWESVFSSILKVGFQGSENASLSMRATSIVANYALDEFNLLKSATPPAKRNFITSEAEAFIG